ncbi:hypothetical protein RC88_13090 [Pectobacterium parvum]|nr:hypothetical protein RC88_13090 [Pectobacterium parvum]
MMLCAIPAILQAAYALILSLNAQWLTALIFRHASRNQLGMVGQTCIFRCCGLYPVARRQNSNNEEEERWLPKPMAATLLDIVIITTTYTLKRHNPLTDAG